MSNIIIGLLASLLAGLTTGLGAIPIFLQLLCEKPTASAVGWIASL